MFTEGDAKETRAKIQKLLDEADDKGVRDLASLIHMGMQVTDMISSLAIARDRMDSDGFGASAGYKPMAVNILTHKDTGIHYQINVVEVDDDDVAGFGKAMERAKPLEEVTKH